MRRGDTRSGSTVPSAANDGTPHRTRNFARGNGTNSFGTQLQKSGFEQFHLPPLPSRLKFQSVNVGANLSFFFLSLSFGHRPRSRTCFDFTHFLRKFEIPNAVSQNIRVESIYRRAKIRSKRPVPRKTLRGLVTRRTMPRFWNGMDARLAQRVR